MTNPSTGPPFTFNTVTILLGINSTKCDALNLTPSLMNGTVYLCDIWRLWVQLPDGSFNFVPQRLNWIRIWWLCGLPKQVKSPSSSWNGTYNVCAHIVLLELAISIGTRYQLWYYLFFNKTYECYVHQSLFQIMAENCPHQREGLYSCMWDARFRAFSQNYFSGFCIM